MQHFHRGTEWTRTSCQKTLTQQLKRKKTCYRPGRDTDVCCPNKETRSRSLIATPVKGCEVIVSASWTKHNTCSLNSMAVEKHTEKKNDSWLSNTSHRVIPWAPRWAKRYKHLVDGDSRKLVADSSEVRALALIYTVQNVAVIKTHSAKVKNVRGWNLTGSEVRWTWNPASCFLSVAHVFFKTDGLKILIYF